MSYVIKVKYPKDVVAVRNIAVFDPGKTIGVAMAMGGNDSQTWIYDVLSCHYTWPSLLAAHDIEQAIIEADYVVAEDFKIYAHKAQSLSWDSVPAARVLGYIEGLCVRHNKPFKTFMAAQAKGFATDEVIEKYKYQGQTPRNRHERDALRHLITFLVKYPEIWRSDV